MEKLCPDLVKPEGERMSTLDDIARERQILGERLAKLDTDRAHLAEQLAELEAAERVLSRFMRANPTGRRGRGATSSAAETENPGIPAGPRRGRQGRRAPPGAATTAGAVSLGDATLRAVAAHGHGVSAEEVRKYIANQLGMQVRPNHLGMALQRHRRAGRLEQRDLLWFPGHSDVTAAAAPE
jgi:hypothetical protein